MTWHFWDFTCQNWSILNSFGLLIAWENEMIRASHRIVRSAFRFIFDQTLGSVRVEFVLIIERIFKQFWHYLLVWICHIFLYRKAMIHMNHRVSLILFVESGRVPWLAELDLVCLSGPCSQIFFPRGRSFMEILNLSGLTCKKFAHLCVVGAFDSRHAIPPIWLDKFAATLYLTFLLLHLLIFINALAILLHFAPTNAWHLKIAPIVCCHVVWNFCRLLVRIATCVATLWYGLQKTSLTRRNLI